MIADMENFNLIVDGKTLVAPCIEVVAFSKTPKADGAEGYKRFYWAFVNRFGGQLTYYQLNDSTKWRPFGGSDVQKVPGWFDDSRSLKAPRLGIKLRSCPTPEDPRPPFLDVMFDHAYREYPRAMMRIGLPINILNGGSSAFLDLVSEALSEFPIHWGTAGYAFFWDSSDTTTDQVAAQWIGPLLVRHPGLSTGEFLRWGAILEQGVANIGWLTFIGDELIAHLGGRDGLSRSILGTSLQMLPYRYGVALKAGTLPEIGDVNRGSVLPNYHDVGKILQPLYAPEERLRKLGVKGIRDPEAAVRWLRRFLP